VIVKIEEAIRQSTFKSERHKMVVNLHYTGCWLRRREGEIFKKHGISSQQFNVLRILKGQAPKPVSLSDVKDRMIDKESNVSRLVDKLCHAQLAHREQCPDDRRQVNITITDKGLDLLADIDPQMEKLKSTLNSLSESETRTLNTLLDKLRSE
jgi:DNA-binding MarR family transcriptional regulator